jgi:hypothetical protein
MRYILIASPDKISLSSFTKFLRRELGQDYRIGSIHSLMSEEAKNAFIEDFCNKSVKGIFSYYAKGIKSSEPINFLPLKAVEQSDFVVWFDLFSTTPVILKDREGCLRPTVTKWNSYIERMSG